MVVDIRDLMLLVTRLLPSPRRNTGSLSHGRNDQEQER
jgi:hypothetical protein